MAVVNAVSKGLRALGTTSKKTMLTAGGAGFGVDMAMNVAGGDDVGTATAKAAVTGAIFASNPLIATGVMAGSLLQDAYWANEKFSYRKKQWWNAQYATNNRVGGNYVDTQRAQTMRQAAVQAIQGSKMNARSALGGEAKILNPYSTRRY
ncbi:hypothetical protein ABFV99_14145 [Cytobacillus horneckiae]|uniref:hypothetical protein n=1 Tax=Cytobacillus horneckiae TaxID=549687 RepID=UPI0034CF33F8